jgi:hypothetical protein
MRPAPIVSFPPEAVRRLPRHPRAGARGEGGQVGGLHAQPAVEDRRELVEVRVEQQPAFLEDH